MVLENKKVVKALRGYGLSPYGAASHVMYQGNLGLLLLAAADALGTHLPPTDTVPLSLKHIINSLLGNS